MSKEEMIKILNEARAEELKAVYQYMNHYYEGQGTNSPPIVAMFKNFAISEMKHAYKCAERITALGGRPVYGVLPIRRGNSLEEMIRINHQDESKAVEMYTSMINKAGEDTTTRRLLEKFLEDEEEHVAEFEKLLK